MKQWQERMLKEINDAEQRLNSLNKWLAEDMDIVLDKISQDCLSPMLYYKSLRNQQAYMTKYLEELKFQVGMWK